MSFMISIKVLLSLVLSLLAATYSGAQYNPQSSSELHSAVRGCTDDGGKSNYNAGACTRDKSKLEDCTITYFGLPGLAEPIRLALAVSGVKYNLETLDRETFVAKKAAGDFPFGQVPVLTLKDGTKIAQSLAIERFVAKHSGLYPDDVVAAAHVDAVLDAVGDFWKAVMDSTAGVDKDSPEFLEKRKECATTGALAQGLERLEGFLQNTGSGGFAVGNSHTIADIHIFAHITFMGSGFWDGVPTDFSNRFARITSIRQKIASHELIKKYYDSKGEKNKYDDLYIAARDLPTSGECPKEFKYDQSKLEGCTVTYFALPGRAEAIRLALAMSGVNFNQDIIDYATFKDRKTAGEFPFGQLPILTLADGTKISQSRAIGRFVAKFSSLYPDDPFAAAQVDAVIDGLEDLGKAVARSTRGVDPTSPEFLEKRKECATTGTLKQGLEKLENFLLKSGTVGYAVGNSHTFADIHVLTSIAFLGCGYWDGIPADFADGFARIKSIRQKISSHEIVKKYYDSKKEKSKYDDMFIAAREFK